MTRSDFRQEEEGASATLFLIALTSLLAVTMLAIDGGSLFVSRRGQVADTDAAALAAAQALTEDPCATQVEVNDVADDYITANDPDTSRVDDVDVTYQAATCLGGGVVTVETTRDASLYFAPLFGYDRVPTAIRSSAVYGQGSTFPAVRPLGICGLDPHYFTEWAPYFTALHDGTGEAAARTVYEGAMAASDLAYGTLYDDFVAHPIANEDGVPYSGADVVHRVVFERLSGSESSDCGGAGGNFGWLDFDSSGNSRGCEDPDTNNELGCRLRQGYEGSVTLGGAGAGDEDCNVDSGSIVDCPAETGARGNSTSPHLDVILCPPATPTESCEYQMLIVVYDSLVGNGANARFHPTSVAGVVLRGYDVGTGQLGADNYLDLEFTDVLMQGEIGPSPPGGTAPFVAPQLCGVGTYDNC